VPDPTDIHGAVAVQLRAAGCVFAEDEAELLIEAANGGRALAQMVERRVAGEPLQYVLGWAQFAGLRMHVAPGVFVPRPRSEFLASQARALVAPGTTVVDLCCGCGALGAAAVTGIDGVELHAADVDGDAVRCARRNVEPIGGAVHEGDLFDALPAELRGTIDVLVVNAPYVPSDVIETMPQEAREHEHRIALDGGSDGLDLHRRIAAHAGEWLRAGGSLLLETSAQQATATQALLRDGGLTTELRHSDELDATVALGRRPG
jgi:release factor glutamine methyltransferase